VAEGNIATNTTDISNINTALTSFDGRINTNASGIALNSTTIANNALGIDTNRAAIALNAAVLGNALEAIDDIRSGSAAIAAIPDLYLQSDDTWRISGGISAYDDGFGGLETGFGGGIQLRGKPSDPWAVGVVGAFSGNTSVMRIQGTFGG